MTAAQHKDRAREEHILACTGYCKIPFRQIHGRDARVILFAQPARLETQSFPTCRTAKVPFTAPRL